MRAIAFVKKLLDEERVPRGRYKDLRIHTIEAEVQMRDLGYSSKLNADAKFLHWLFELGRERASQFLAEHRAKIGHEILDRHRGEVSLARRRGHQGRDRALAPLQEEELVLGRVVGDGRGDGHLLSGPHQPVGEHHGIQRLVGHRHVGEAVGGERAARWVAWPNDRPSP